MEYFESLVVNNADGCLYLCMCVRSFISLKEWSDNQWSARWRGYEGQHYCAVGFLMAALVEKKNESRARLCTKIEHITLNSFIMDVVYGGEKKTAARSTKLVCLTRSVAITAMAVFSQASHLSTASC